MHVAPPPPAPVLWPPPVPAAAHPAPPVPPVPPLLLPPVVPPEPPPPPTITVKVVALALSGIDMVPLTLPPAPPVLLVAPPPPPPIIVKPTDVTCAGTVIVRSLSALVNWIELLTVNVSFGPPQAVTALLLTSPV